MVRVGVGVGVRVRVRIRVGFEICTVECDEIRVRFRSSFCLFQKRVPQQDSNPRKTCHDVTSLGICHYARPGPR